MDNDTFLHLLKGEERDILDYKKEPYKLVGFDKSARRASQAAFVKDIASMFNTPRGGSAYIVIGVKKYPGKDPELAGISEHPDDANLQEILDEWLNPCPAFSYHPIEHGGKEFGVIEIPVRRDIGWVMPKKDFEKTVEHGKLYVRKNSRNSVATQLDIKRVNDWFESSDGGLDNELGGVDAWNEFSDYVSCFSKDYNHILVLSSLSNVDPDLLGNIGQIPWSYVFDFDPNSNTDGVLCSCKSDLENLRSLHLVACDDAISINPRNSTYWYFSAGLASRKETMPEKAGDYKAWRKKYIRDSRERIESLASALLPHPSMLIVVWDDESTSAEYLRTILDLCADAFDEHLSVAIVVPQQSGAISGIADLLSCKTFVLPISEFLHGLRSVAIKKTEDKTGEYEVPSSSGAPVSIDLPKYQWLSEELEIVHLDVASQNLTLDSREYFLRGGSASWEALSERADVERSVYPRLSKSVNQALARRRTVRLNLYHEPGAGGTTIARRLLWDLHKSYPCVILVDSDTASTAQRLSFLASLTNQPILAVVDYGVVGELETDALYERARADHIPVVLLQVHRRAKKPADREGSGIFLTSELSGDEIHRMINSLVSIRPAREQTLRNTVKSGRPQERTPFYLSLIAFEKDFVGIERYVDVRLDELSPEQSKVILFLSLAHFYGQRSIVADAFQGVLSLPPNRPVDLSKALPLGVINLLISDDQGRWRTCHPLIAERSLIKLLSSGLKDERAWTQKLSSASKEFASFCRGEGSVPYEDGVDLIYQVFISREGEQGVDSAPLGKSTPNARIINDIPSFEGQHSVLRHLTEVFPGDPHLWAHLGRFESAILKEHKEALASISYAIELSDHDGVLWHIKGMIQRNQTYKAIDDGESVDNVVALAAEASLSFEQARELAPHDDHGFISEVQMILKVLDYAGMSSNTSPILVSTTSGSPWLREAFGKAEELLADVRKNHQGEAPSILEERCRADLSRLYGNVSDALQRWDNLLTRGEVYSPPIRRQIVWAYLARHGRQWKELPKKEVKRAVQLLEENLEQEGGTNTDYRNWMQACRILSPTPDIDSVVERVAYWKINSQSVDAVYYLYVLYAIKALEGSALAAAECQRQLDECRQRSRYLRNRTRSYEWLGQGAGLSRLVHHEQLGKWSQDAEFWSDASLLERVTATIRSIQGSQAGELELTGGLRAFFVPGKSGHFKGHSENRRVRCYIGFSYDGIRAWSVEDVD